MNHICKAASRFADAPALSCLAVVTISLLVPAQALTQCQPVTDSVKPPATRQDTQSVAPAFFDEPKFTVAGVTDATTPGGHGSDTVLRTKESLAKDTVSLGKDSSSQAHSGQAATEKSPRAAAHAPESFDANYQQGESLLAEGKPREALPYLERASRLNPADRTTQDKASLHHLMAKVEEQLGNPLEAVHQFQAAAELDPTEPNLFDWGGELLLHRAVDPAIEVLAKGNRLFPTSMRMLLGLGVALYDRGSYDQAARCLCQASDLKPYDPTPYLFLGKIEDVEIAPLPGVAERLERFVRLEPENALANYYYAVSLWKQRKSPEDTSNYPQVNSLLHKAVHLDPKLGAAYLQMGILYAEQKDFPQAISAYQRAIEATPRLEEAYYRLAQVYRQNGKQLKAQQELEVYSQLKKESAGDAERQRHDIKEFVYTLRSQPPASPPK
ncbi:MAG: tetratricopeptide repeat protein [Acidobacteriia bacterium]|nr:tetratricopeptide repeat protein [Terriglobia bacterium]